ncbi:hypothetical protein PG987_015425 [Apiospora arundinis]
MIISTDVKVHFTRYGCFYKTVGLFDPFKILHLHVFECERFSPLLLTLQLETPLCNSVNIESAQLTTYSLTSILKDEAEIKHIECNLDDNCRVIPE